MIYSKECPYCKSQIQRYTYISSNNIKQYVFICDCTHGALRYNEDAAYEQYLHEREDNQITNFDLYFSNLKTKEDLNIRMNELCEFFKGNCEQCIWSTISQNLTDDESADCFSFWRWAIKTHKKD